MFRLPLLLLLLCSACSLKTPKPTVQDQIPTDPKVFSLADKSALFTWDYTQTPGTSSITGFKLQLGTAPNTYTRTIDIAGKDTRSYTATNLDTSLVNYGRLYSVSDWALSAPTEEISFGGKVAPPFFFRTSPVNP